MPTLPRDPEERVPYKPDADWRNRRYRYLKRAGRWEQLGREFPTARQIRKKRKERR